METTSYNWKNNTVAFLSSQAISIFGSSLVQYAIIWHITLTTQSGVFATLAILFGFLPTFFLSPFAGVWADRYNRKRLIVLADGGIAIATLVLALLFMAGNNSIWLLLGAMAVRALGSAVQQPCINAMLPDLVPTEHLTRVNGINGSILSLITLVSPMVSGALMGFAPLQAIFFIDVVTAALAIGVLIIFFHLPQRAKLPKPASGAYFREMKEGFSYIFQRGWLRNFFIMLIIFYAVIGPLSFLTPLQVSRTFGNEVWRLTATEVAFSVGMLAGGILISVWGGLKSRVHMLGITGIIMSVGAVALGMPIRFWPYIAIMGGIGIVMPLFNTPAVVMLQERVDPAYIGRTFGVMTMLSTSIMPASMLVFGPLADVIPIAWLLIGTGIVMAILSAAMMLNKPLVAAGRPLQAKQDAA